MGHVGFIAAAKEEQSLPAVNALVNASLFSFCCTACAREGD